LTRENRGTQKNLSKKTEKKGKGEKKRGQLKPNTAAGGQRLSGKRRLYKKIKSPIQKQCSHGLRNKIRKNPILKRKIRRRNANRGGEKDFRPTIVEKRTRWKKRNPKHGHKVACERKTDRGGGDKEGAKNYPARASYPRTHNDKRKARTRR